MTALTEAEEIARAAWDRPIPEAPTYLRQRPIWPEPRAVFLPPRPLPRRSPSGGAIGWLLVAIVVIPLVTWVVLS